MTKKLNVESEVEKTAQRFDNYSDHISKMTVDEMNKAPMAEEEPQTKLSNIELKKSKDVYLKPTRTFPPKERFNEEYRDSYNYAKEYVRFIAENKEIIGESIELWTKAFPGINCELWKVPVNTPLWGPRYLAEQLSRCKYHVMRMDQTVKIADDGWSQQYGQMVVQETKHRLDAMPVKEETRIFLGARSF